MSLPGIRAVLPAGLLALSACAGATPNPRSVEDCNERTVRAFWESLDGDTILVRRSGGFNPPIACRDGETAASCEARARERLLATLTFERPVYSCTSEAGASCWAVRHHGELSTLPYPGGKGWDRVGEALWGRWGHDEVELLASSFGDVRTASASAPIEDGDGAPHFILFLRHPSRKQAWAEIKEVARGWSSLRVSMAGGDGSTWQSVRVSCRPKDEPHPSAHEGPWHCFGGMGDTNELVADECLTSERSCAIEREHMREELRFRKLDPEEAGQCTATPRVYCYEIHSEYADLGAWQSHRSYFCYPSRERCERFQSQILLHASVESQCFEASPKTSGR